MARLPLGTVIKSPMNLEELKQLVEPLIPPYATSTWPPAPWVWWLIGGLVGLLLLVMIIRWYRRTHVRRYAYTELDAIHTRYQQNQDAARYLYEVNLLLRRIAVRNFSRDKVAALTGEDWLEFLDWGHKSKQDGDPGFMEGSGRILAWGAYQAQPESFEVERLQKLVKAWIRRQT